MKKPLIIWYLVITFSICTAQQQVKTKIFKQVLSDGYALYSVALGMKPTSIDPEKYYYWYSEDSGQKETKGSYSGFILHGTSQVFNSMGNLIEESNYNLGLKDGRLISWNDENEYNMILNYKNGVCYKGKFISPEYPFVGSKDSYVEMELKNIDLNAFSSKYYSLEKLNEEKKEAERSCICIGVPGCAKTIFSTETKLQVFKYENIVNDKKTAIGSKSTWYFEGTNKIEIVVFAFASEDGKDYLERTDNYYANGKIKNSISTKNKKLHGITTIYNEDGSKIIRNYSEDILLSETKVNK